MKQKLRHFAQFIPIIYHKNRPLSYFLRMQLFIMLNIKKYFCINIHFLFFFVNNIVIITSDKKLSVYKSQQDYISIKMSFCHCKNTGYYSIFFKNMFFYPFFDIIIIVLYYRLKNFRSSFFAHLTSALFKCLLLNPNTEYLPEITCIIMSNYVDSFLLTNLQCFGIILVQIKNIKEVKISIISI